MASFTTKYTHGDILFLRVNDERKRGMVVAINIRPHGTTLYEVGWPGGSSTWHYEIELSTEHVPEWVDENAGSARDATP